MSQFTGQPEDLEGRNLGVHGHLDPHSMPDQPSQGESNFGDSSEQLFSLYSKASEEEDSKMAESWQKDADGILIFTGLFSASVAAFLSVTVQDLRPNSQDTSVFYLGNIYEVLADPNATSTSVPSPVARPPPFFPPTYSIWVNSLWFLSFVLSLICALLATSLQQWARRYIRVTQPARCSPEKRARMRAFFANGVDMLGARLVVERLPMLLHLSLFLFFAGLGIFLFNTNHAVFNSVIWLIALFSTIYVVLTLIPMFLLQSPYFTPLSDPLFRSIHLDLAINTAIFTAFFLSGDLVSSETRERFMLWASRRFRWAMGGVEKGAEDIVSNRSWEVDLRILRWSIGALGDDDALEKLFEAIPGFFDSKMVKHLEGDFPKYLLNRFWNALNGFLRRTLTSNLVSESVKSHRLDIGMKAMNVISNSRTSSPSSIPCDIIVGGWNKMPQISEMGPDKLLTYCTGDHELTAHYARCVVAKTLATVPERDGRWIQLAIGAFGLSEHDLQNYIDDGDDSVSLAISIPLIRQSIHLRFYDWDALKAFSKLNDIRNALPGLQHDFCTLWNEVVQEARNRRGNMPPIMILRWSRHHYIALHEDTDAAPTNFSSSTDAFDPVLSHPSSYPLCTISDHRPQSSAPADVPDSPSFPVPSQTGDSPDGSPHQPTPGGGTVQRQAEEVNIIPGPLSPFDLKTTNDIRETAEAPTAIPFTFPIKSGPRFIAPSHIQPIRVRDDGRDQDQTVPEVFRHQTQSLRPVPSPLDTDIATNALKVETQGSSA